MDSGKSWLRVKLSVDVNWRLVAALGALLKLLLLYHFA
jgi:hypothetical protein